MSTAIIIIAFYLVARIITSLVSPYLVRRYQQWRQSLVDRRYIKQMRNTSHSTLPEVTFDYVDTNEWEREAKWVLSKEWVPFPYIVRNEVLN